MWTVGNVSAQLSALAAAHVATTFPPLCQWGLDQSLSDAPQGWWASGRRGVHSFASRQTCPS